MLEVEIINSHVFDAYKNILIGDFFIISTLVIGLFLFKIKIYPALKARCMALALILSELLKKLKKAVNFDSRIIKIQGLKSYSVADELLKWSKLRDEGLVSEDEYHEARAKLLGHDQK